MKRLVKIITSSLFLAMMFSFNSGAMAQNIGDQNTAAVSNYDPISANLDSLVNLTYIQRLQSNVTPATTFKSYEVPTYSADVYKRRMEKIQTPIPLVYNNQVEE